jgi:hypothetical protein
MIESWEENKKSASSTGPKSPNAAGLLGVLSRDAGEQSSLRLTSIEALRTRLRGLRGALFCPPSSAHQHGKNLVITLRPPAAAPAAADSELDSDRRSSVVTRDYPRLQGEWPGPRFRSTDAPLQGILLRRRRASHSFRRRFYSTLSELPSQSSQPGLSLAI